MNRLFDTLLLLDLPNHLQILFVCMVCMLCWMIRYHCVTSKYFDRVYEALQEGHDRETVLEQIENYPISATLRKDLLGVVNSYF